jgi:hypothetical protein
VLRVHAESLTFRTERTLMRTEWAIDHSELAGRCTCGSPRAITTPVACRDSGLLASTRSVGYPQSAGAELVRRNCNARKCAAFGPRTFQVREGACWGGAKKSVHHAVSLLEQPTNKFNSGAGALWGKLPITRLQAAMEGSCLKR